MFTDPHNHFKFSTFNEAWILSHLVPIFSTASFLLLNYTQECQNGNKSNTPNFLMNQREYSEGNK